MTKLDFDKISDISLRLGDDTEPIIISVAMAYSWNKIVATQTFLDKTYDLIKKWYWSRKNLENVIDGYMALWKALKEAVGELFLLDFIRQGEFSYKVENLTARYDEEYGTMFDSAFSEIKSIYEGLSVDQITKEAYRALRKETRGRVIGIGHGFKGGIASALGAEFGNAATGLGHSIANAIGNSIDKASTNDKLNNFYTQESTLQGILDTWSVIFWKMYDNHINLVNIMLVEEGTAQLFNFSLLMDLKDSAFTIYNNMHKAKNISDENYFNGIFQCVKEFPFEAHYWKDFLNIIIWANSGNKDISNSVFNFSKEMDDYVPGFNNEIISDSVECLLNMHIGKTINNNEYSEVETVAFFNENLGNENFENCFLAALTNIYKNSETGTDELKVILDLLKKLNRNIDQYFRDDTFFKAYEEKTYILAQTYVEERKVAILQALINGTFDSITDDLVYRPMLTAESILLIVIYMVYNKIVNENDTTITNEILTNIDKLKNTLNVNRDLNDLKTYSAIKTKLTPIETKIRRFYAFIDGMIHENGVEILGSHVYWKEIAKDINEKIRINFTIPENEQILVVFDDTVFNSGKSGLVLTSKAIYKKNESYSTPWCMTWEYMVDQHYINLLENLISIVANKSDQKNKINLIEFGGLAVNISFVVLSNILKAACLIFTGNNIEIMNFKVVTGAEFDIEKLDNYSELKINDGTAKEIQQQEYDKTQELTQAISSQRTSKSEERYHYLCENDRIYKALKFKEKKGFFRHILPASWIITIGFYGLVSLLILLISSIFTSQTNSQLMIIIVSNLTVIVIPIILLIIGIKNRVKYITEKRVWRECTDNGKREIKEVYKEYQEMENEYLGI